MIDLHLLAVRHLVFPIGDRLRGIPIGARSAELDRSQWWSRGELDALRDQRVSELVRHAYDNVAYYRRVMRELRLTPADIRSEADLPKLPILTKDIVRREGDALRARNVDPRSLFRGTTGGSTGEPMPILHDRPSRAMSQAAFRRGLGWAGLDWGQPVISISGGLLGTARPSLTQRFQRRVTRAHFLPAFELTHSTIRQAADRIREVGPKALLGYTSGLVALAGLLEEAGERVHVPLVFTTAEVLLPDHVERLERVLGAKVFDYYGCGEINSIAYQCERQSGYHLVDEKVIVEHGALDTSGRADEQARVWLTDLSNYGFPLIRYENGDFVELTEAPCACGRSLRRIARVGGRVHDFIVGTEGNLLAGEFFPHMFKWVNNVRQFQIIQERLGELRILLVTEPAFSARDEAFVTDKVREYLGSSMRIRVERVAEIPRTRAGKLRVTVSHLDPALLIGPRTARVVRAGA